MSVEPLGSFETAQDQPLVVERFYEREGENGSSIQQRTSRIFYRQGLVALLAVLTAPWHLLALITIDLPATWLDALPGVGGALPSSYLSRGEALLLVALPCWALITRRWGPAVALRVLAVSWLLTALFFTALMIDLAPQLQSADFPQGRFVWSLIAAWVAGQSVVIGIYQLTRGGAWWRAPFVAVICGASSQALIYFPLAYAGMNYPWASWMGTQALLGVVVAGLFLAVYRPLRQLIQPHGGLGGR